MKRNLEREPRGDDQAPHLGGPIHVFYHDDFLLHDPYPIPHPENPDRLRIALRAIRKVEGTVIREPCHADPWKAFSRVHDGAYIDRVRGAVYQAVDGPVWLDPDTYVVRETERSLARLACAVEDGVSLAETSRYVVVLGRPPGHHAGRLGAAMGAPTLGFCIFNASGLAAKLLSEKGRVAVLDFDLHHGNGTQDILWDTSVLHVDIHQDPSTVYPGTGYPWQTGGIPGTKVNIVVPPRAGDDVYLDALGVARRLIEEYDPDYLVVSAGFDAYEGDYLLMRATEVTFSAAGAMVSSLGVPVVVVLEGGYGPGLERGLPAFLASLRGGSVAAGEGTRSSEWVWREYRRALEALFEALGR